MKKQNYFSQARFVFMAGGETATEGEKKGPDLQKKMEGQPLSPQDASDQAKLAGAKLVNQAGNNAEELAEEDLQTILDKCMDADDYYIQSVDRNAYAGKEEKAEKSLLDAAKTVPWLKPAVDEYIAAYKAPNKPNVPTPNVLVEKLANQVYKQFSSKFTDANGSTYNGRSKDLLNYVQKPSDEKAQIAKAKEAKQWFAAAEDVIKKGRST